GILLKVDWLTPLVTMLVAFPILALDEIGVELQNPFSTLRLNHLPLDKICENLERNLTALQNESEQSRFSRKSSPAAGHWEGQDSALSRGSGDPQETRVRRQPVP